MSNHSYLNQILEFLPQVSNAILDIYSKDFTTDYKSDNSPLTEADLASHQMISGFLSKLTPGYPILSEEGEDIPYEIRKNWKKCWIVDPLDGTREFVKKNGEFTINISLIDNQKSVLGVIHAPTSNHTYYAIKGEGAFLKTENDLARLPLNFKSSEIPKIVCSRSHFNSETEDFLSNYFKNKNYEKVKVGSSLKFCLLAEGRVDLYPRCGSIMEWDSSAAQIIVEESGGKLLDWKTHEPLVYNKEDLRNPWFIGYSATSKEL